MPKNSKGTYDVIVIGAGIGGLVCGSFLAKAGMKILVVEQHDRPGGYCASFKRSNFIFDAAAHSLGGYREGKNFRQIVTELGIDKMIRVTRLDPSDIVLAPDFRITFWNDTKKTIADLASVFPREKENIYKYYNYYDRLSSANQFENVKLKDQTYGLFLKSYFSDNALISAISYPIFGYAGLPPSLMHAFTGTKFFNETLIDGGYYLEGGMQTLPNAFAQVIKQNNGTILYNSTVKEILCKNNIATGIELSNNESYASEYIVSACDIIQTYRTFLKKNMVDQLLLEKLKSFSPSISSVILYVGIDKHFEDLPSPGTNIWYLPHYDLDKMHNHVIQADINNIGGGGFMLRVAPDKKTIFAICNTSFKSQLFWKQNKKKISEVFLNKVAGIVPNLKKHTVYFDAATPNTLFRYTLNHEGANYGWAPLQSQLFDPDFRQKSFIKGLYLTGHWTAQTHGIPGVAYLGYNTAKLILRHARNHIR